MFSAVWFWAKTEALEGCGFVYEVYLSYGDVKGPRSLNGVYALAWTMAIFQPCTTVRVFLMDTARSCSTPLMSSYEDQS